MSEMDRRSLFLASAVTAVTALTAGAASTKAAAQVAGAATGACKAPLLWATCS